MSNERRALSQTPDPLKESGFLVLRLWFGFFLSILQVYMHLQMSLKVP